MTPNRISQRRAPLSLRRKRRRRHHDQATANTISASRRTWRGIRNDTASMMATVGDREDVAVDEIERVEPEPWWRPAGGRRARARRRPASARRWRRASAGRPSTTIAKGVRCAREAMSVLLRLKLTLTVSGSINGWRAATSPGGAGIGGLRPPSEWKNADAKHRWSEANVGSSFQVSPTPPLSLRSSGRPSPSRGRVKKRRGTLSRYP